MFTEITSDNSGQAALFRFRTTNTWNAQQIFKAATTTAPGFVAQGTGTISAIPAVDANAIAQFQGTEAVTSHVVWDSAGAPNHVYFRRSNGTYASPTAIASTDILGSVQWQGRGATTFGSTVQAQIRATATQAFTDTAKGTDLVFLTTASGAAVTATALTLNASLATFTGTVQGTGNAITVAGVIARANGTISANPVGFSGQNIAFHSIGAQAVTTLNMFDSCGGALAIAMRRRNGTYSAQTAVLVNDSLGQIDASGWDTATFRQNAQIQFFAVENFTSAANGTAILFSTTPAGTTTLTTRLTLNTTANFTVPVISGGNYVRVTTAQTPATSAAAGTTGDIAWDDTYLYVRMSTGWRRIALGAAC
jgi:hypothetical protein